MSSCGNPNAEADALMARRPKYDRSKDCVKCKLNAGNIVIRHAVYCKDCFFPLVSLRFRRTLEPHVNPSPDLHRRKGLKASGNLLVALSGGLTSTVLLDLVYKTYLSPCERQDGDQNPNGGCPWPRIFVAHVDLSGVTPEAKDETLHIKHIVEEYNAIFEYLPLKLEDAFDKEWWQSIKGIEQAQATALGITGEDIFLKPLSSESSPLSSLRAYIASLPTQTAISNAIKTLIRVLLLYTAASARSSHLLLGTSLTSLSISLISSISQGGGYSVKEESQEEWTYGSRTSSNLTVRIIRPLRDVGVKECAFWAWWYDLRVVGKHRHSGGRQDISALTRDFIMGLEKDYPSTVSAIARTCNKLTTKGDTIGKCPFCERPAQFGTQEWKHKISIRSYRDLRPDHNPPLGVKLDADLPGDYETNHSHQTIPNICYSCHTAWTSKTVRGNPVNPTEVPVPVWVSLPNVDGKIRGTRKVEAKDMRDMIKDFLLDPGSQTERQTHLG